MRDWKLIVFAPRLINGVRKAEGNQFGQFACVFHWHASFSWTDIIITLSPSNLDHFVT